ncbi:ABC transporter substrate-binding protein [Rhodoplanes sp. Z2-YC6860]|uniref:ABC transporter substrate-binding protein n=1 Tax=Rhodoplanes sp. Z2-YC6860 TaxID=674703 RepID=UPI00078B9EDD|nr:ABC transporter substrate-binding protein [Rhodoplanes sp. Z2-YC6860]AMN44885.1 4,5-dihydroxyphthalate decarboxylase [Rhodoplanes sp. Z2-YC6860]
MQPLTFALGNYGVTKPIKDSGGPAGKALSHLRFIEVSPIIAAMRRMCRGLEFDICEMAFTTYLCARAVGKPFTAIPVFVTRNFHHWAIFINTKSGIKEPKDLEGRKVGVNRGYTVTTGLWARGVLQSEYGVDLDKVTWVPTDDEHVAEFEAPNNVDYSFRGAKMQELLLSGKIDAAIGEVGVDAPEVKPLLPNARADAFGYFRKTGIYPINHGVVIKDSVLKEKPGIADELYRAFEAAKAEYLKNLDRTEATTSWDAAAKVNKEVVGDPFPFGIEPNRKALEAITQFAVDQKMVPRKFTVEELFVPAA